MESTARPEAHATSAAPAGRLGVWKDSRVIEDPEEEHMSVVRHAEVTWQGTLIEGAGTIDYVSSGAFSRMPVTWASRTSDHAGRTSPEELIAAAHASCFSMALSSRLAKNQTPATELKVVGRVTFDQGEAGWGITSSRLEVHAVVPGIDDARFQELAADAKEKCPVSQALRGNVDISVDATLEPAPASS
jgi:osmotically inducible protein OsmC